jgi:hypothetical protein
LIEARKLKEELSAAFGQGYDSAFIFTQYTDAVDYLKEFLAEELPGLTIATYTGDGGAQRDASGAWVRCSKETVKRRLSGDRERDRRYSGGAAESSELMPQALFAESFWKPATDFHPMPVAVPETPAGNEPLRQASS